MSKAVLEAAKKVEDSFAKNLTDVVRASKKQDMYEHWDMVGKLDDEAFRFEVKGKKKFNRKVKLLELGLQIQMQPRTKN